MNKVKNSSKFAHVCIISLMLFFVPTVNASLLVSPTRVVFDDRDRVQEVILINTSTKTNTYRLEWEDKFALETGGYVQDYDESLFEKTAQPYLRFSPRQIILGPGERQIIKVMLRRTSSTDNDEFRSHLKFVVIPPKTEPSSSNEPGIRMKLDLFFNYSLPVIVRKGDPKVEVKMVNTELKINPVSNNRELFVTMDRLGKSSFIGNLRLVNIHNGVETIVGRLNDIRLFPEHNQYTRRIIITEEIQGMQGQFEVRLAGDKEFSNVPIQTLIVQI